jgi:AcrR family transcriptional regulator
VTTAAPPRLPRSDALRNRERLLCAAHEVFAEHGVDASVQDIVRRAGVGVGTLYRHFPTREDLVAAIFDEHIGELATVARETIAIDDGTARLRTFLERAIELRRRDPFLKQLFIRYPQNDPRLSDARAEIRELLEELLELARLESELRADFTVADLVTVFWSLGPVLDATEQVAPDAWRRHLGFVLDGLRPEAATAAVVPPMDTEQLDAATRSLRAARTAS